MKKNKISEITKKHNKEIAERILEVVGVKNYVDLPKKTDISESDIANFKNQDTKTFYKKFIGLGIKHDACVNWIYSGKGEKRCKSVMPMAEVVCEPGIPFRTPEDQKYVDMVLEVLRNADEQDRKSLMRSIELFYEHYKRREGDIKKAQDC